MGGSWDCSALQSCWEIDVYKRQELRCLRLWPQERIEACLWAFILSMAFIQLGRMNIELDYDSLHYGLRSAFVLDNGKGLYENLGMMNLVYT